MQLYAFNQDKKVIFALQAYKGEDYFCIECGKTVRLRNSVRRKVHFYHLSPNQHCRHFGKSMIHLQTQMYIFNLLPAGECHLEYRFTDYNRIADVFWITKNIVFEIQCSSISSQEVEARNRDYAKAGLQVIWILHERNFNQWRVSSVEHFLQDKPKYFTNMNEEGNGIIYDQIDLIEKGKRKRIPQKWPVNVGHKLDKNGPFSFDQYPEFVQNRLRTWPFYFEGDIVCRIVNADDEFSCTIEKSKLSQVFNDKQCQKSPFAISHLLRFLTHSILKPYRLLLQILLEKASY